MDLSKALAELREQRDNIDQAILSLERLASGRPRGPGRPPGKKSIAIKPPSIDSRQKGRKGGIVPS
jgi:hypothetical protein